MTNNYAYVVVCILNYCVWAMPHHFRRLQKFTTWQRSVFISLNIKYLCLCVWFCSLVVHPLFLFSLLPCSSKTLQRYQGISQLKNWTWNMIVAILIIIYWTQNKSCLHSDYRHTCYWPKEIGTLREAGSILLKSCENHGEALQKTETTGESNYE